MRIVKYKDLDEVLLIQLKDLINSKVNSLEDYFIVQIEPLQIVGLYNYQTFNIECYYKISKIGSSFLVNIEINSLIPMNCDLCGNQFIYSFSFKAQEIFTPNFEPKNTLEDLSYFIFYGDEIDIGRICLENFISNLPSTFHDDCKQKKNVNKM